MSIIKGTNQIVAGFGGTKRSIGEVYFSQSSLATDNSGALPLFTGETIASANTIYPDFYNWVLSHTELQCTSEEYESALTTYGECAKYVIGKIGDNATAPDYGTTTIAAGSIRLPLIKNYIKSANTAEGVTQKGAGLPNITGYLTSMDTNGRWGLIANAIADYYNTYSGAFRAQNNGSYSQSVSTGKAVASGDLYFDASRSSAVYGKSDTVTPAHTTLYPWVYAFNAAVPASTAQAAEFQQALSGKADTNLGNTIPSQSFKKMSVSWDMPDYSAGVDISSSLKAVNSSWVAPSDGIIFANVINNNVVYLFRQSGCRVPTYDYSQYTLIAINGEDYIVLTDKVDVRKDDIIYTSTNEPNSGKIYFYPFKGVN